MIQVELGIKSGSESGILERIREIYIRKTRQYYAAVRNGSPGRLASAWTWADRSGKEFLFEVANNLPWANWGIRGRGPGKMPPVDSVRVWANKRGIPPYLVARKIGRVGTERWRQNRNWVGITREDKVAPGGLIERTNEIIAAEIKRELN